MGMKTWHPCHENVIHDLVYILQIFDVNYVGMYLKFKIIEYILTVGTYRYNTNYTKLYDDIL